MESRKKKAPASLRSVTAPDRPAGESAAGRRARLWWLAGIAVGVAAGCAAGWLLLA